jgi:hypothetical protein
VRLLDATRTSAVGAARSTGSALQVVLTRPLDGVPSLPGLPTLNRVYVATVLLGGTGVVAAASDSGQLGSAPLPALPDTGQTPLAPNVVPRTPPGDLTPDRAPAAQALPPVLARPIALVAGFDLASVALALLVVPTGLLLLWRLSVQLRRRPA